MDVNRYTTVLDALVDLKKRGYAQDFKVGPAGLSTPSGKALKPEEATIVEYHRFEGETDPADMAVVYAVEFNDGTRGVLLDAYGAYADPVISEIVRRMKLKDGI